MGGAGTSLERERPRWAAAVFTTSFVLGIAVGLATVLLGLARDVGCSLEDDCGTGSWLVVLAALAVLSVAAPFVGWAALRGRSGSEAGWTAASVFGPGVVWVMAFVLIAT